MPSRMSLSNDRGGNVESIEGAHRVSGDDLVCLGENLVFERQKRQCRNDLYVDDGEQRVAILLRDGAIVPPL